jgi:superfamily I DNA and/or RNA helicase
MSTEGGAAAAAAAPVGDQSKRSGFLLMNPHEVKAVCAIAEGLRLAGFNLAELGVISPYRSQVHALKEALNSLLQWSSGALRDAEGPASSGTNRSETSCPCDVSTVDRFQGRDMDTIIFSTVRGGEDASVSPTSIAIVD